MAIRSRELWRRLEASAGRTLLHVTGQVTFGDETALDAVAGALAAAGAPVERLAPGEAARRFPGNRGARVRALRARHRASWRPTTACAPCARRADFSLHTGMRVTSLRQRPDSVTVATAGGPAFEADVVVDCAGPHALGLLGGDRPVAAAPSLPQVAYFGPAPGGGRERLPVFIEWGDDMIYGLPVPGGGRHGGTYKVSHHTPGAALDAFDPADPAPLRRRPGPPRPVDRRRPPPPALPGPGAGGDGTLRLRQLRRHRLRHRTGSGNIVVGCGTSGHGFKFGPLLGELLADLADGTRAARSTSAASASTAAATRPGGDGRRRVTAGRLRACPATSPCSGA